MKRREYDAWRKSIQPVRKPRSVCGAGIVYLWRVVCPEQGLTDIYKIGITTASCMDSRIRRVSRLHQVGYQIVVWTRHSDPRAVESQILRIGCPAKMKGADGFTEFRRLSDADRLQVIDIIRNKNIEESACILG